MSARDIVATITAKPGRGDAVAAILADARDAVRAEQGCLRYDLFRVRREDDVLLMVERWASKDDLRAHDASDHFVELSGRMAAELDAAPVVRVLEPVSPDGASS